MIDPDYLKTLVDLVEAKTRAEYVGYSYDDSHHLFTFRRDGKLATVAGTKEFIEDVTAENAALDLVFVLESILESM